MACAEQKSLAHFIKQVHASLRKGALEDGAENAWRNHCEKKDLLKKYAYCMQQLATTYWNQNRDSGTVLSRIDWTAKFCLDYFINGLYVNRRQKEIDIAMKINLKVHFEEQFDNPIKIIDVGSCFNGFQTFDFLDVLALDLCPANDSVLQCDFLNVSIGENTNICENKVLQLKEAYYDGIVFCFVLEYIPTSELRIKACLNAYELLKPGGLLLISTPDSKHVGSNCILMKCWQYTLACIGFNRIKYEKFKHMHCMAFRKSLHKDIAVRWAKIHQKPYMEFSISIPQDFQVETNRTEQSLDLKDRELLCEDFMELPFSNDL